MNKTITTLIFIALSIFSANAQTFDYQNTNLSPSQRADDLLKRLTIDEKVALMQNSSPAVPRLGIKQYDWWSEVLHGVARAGLATVFPQVIGMAASFDDALVRRVFTAVSDEARAKYAVFSKNNGVKRYQGLTVWTPNINIFRDPRWGRGQECYGEDPYLTSQMGVAVIESLQGLGQNKYDKLHACAKHFAVHSGPEWNRHSFNAENISLRDLNETYLPAFKAAVQKADVREVMCAYNRFEGAPCCGSNQLLTQILRKNWGYKGIVVSDCGAISDFYKENGHLSYPDSAHSAAAAVLSGTDLECGNNYRTLTQAVKNGLIDENEIDISLKRLLTARFQLGEMDTIQPWQIPYSVVNCAEHRALALQMARESMVLLQNKNNILPLDKNLKIAVMGPNANDSVMQWGNYNGFPAHTVTFLEAIKAKLPNAQIIYQYGCDRTIDLSLQSLFNECSIDGKAGFSAKYWNIDYNKHYKNRRLTETFWNDIENETPTATAQLTTPFHFTTMGATAWAAGVSTDCFAAVYKTVFHSKKSADVSFYFQVEGNAMLFIDGIEVAKIRNAKNNTNAYTLKAEANKDYSVEIRFENYRRESTLNFDFGIAAPLNLQARVASVKDADVVIFVGGISPLLEGEEMSVEIDGFRGGDRTDIELPNVQRKLLRALKDAGKRVVFVNCSGSAMALVPETESCDAILQAWYSGEQGGTAVADVIFGDYNPAGRLPITFYRDLSQLPDYEDYSMKNRTYRYMTQKPLFDFGYGLSFTTFAYGNARLQKGDKTKNEKFLLTIPVTNTGKRNGDEVVQVYLCRPNDTAAPTKTLRAFKRVNIPAGKTVNVTFTLTDESFLWFDVSTNTMRVLSGKYELLYGSSSRNDDLKTIDVSI